jgi:uncharacterized repeat protein (TIGR01451 family)
VLVVAAVAAAFWLADARTASADTFKACGRSGVAAGNGVTCSTLADALQAAVASFGPDTIELFPGSYCPVDIEGEVGNITIRGIGVAGIQINNGPTSLVGPEAALSAFSWDSSCGDFAPSALVQVNGDALGRITLENLAADGSGGGSQDGIDSSFATLQLTDVLAENNSGFGIHYLGDDFEMDKSASIANQYGIGFGGEGSAVDSTFSGNTSVGVELQNYDFHLINDTVSGNLWGVDANCCGSHLQVFDSIVAGNGVVVDSVQMGGDCKATVDWENAFSGRVLKGTTCTTGSSDDGTDIAYDTSHAIPASALNGGPTPSILPPDQAVGAGVSCAFTFDQREFRRSGSCTIGSVDPSADGTPDPEPETTPLAFGDVDAGVTTSRAETVVNNGGDHVGVSSVNVSGAGFSIVGDTCTDASLASGCSVSVALTTPSAGMYSGTLTIDTTGGTVTVPVSAHAVDRPLGADDTYDVVFGHELDVAVPGVLANDASGTTVFDVPDEPAHGTLVGPAANGSFSYTPTDGFSGADSFTYRIVDGQGVQSDPITVELDVSGPVLYVDAGWAGTTIGADPDGSGPATSFGTDAFATIGDAIDAATDSAVIHVAAGTYTETSLDLQNANVQILGAGASTTHLTLATTFTIEGGADDVSGLDIHGTLLSGSPAVRFEDLGSTLEDSAVSDATTGVFIHGSGEDGEDFDRAVSVESPFAPSSGVTVTNDDIHGVQIGVELDGVSDGVVSGNDIHGLTGTADDYLAAILIDDDLDNQPAPGNEISGNTIGSGADTGIDVETSDNTISGNTITGDDVGIELVDDSSDVVQDNEITNNVISSSDEDAILQTDTSGDSTGNSADHNDITGSGTDGVENDDAASFDARNNWWGSASGPSGEGTGTGDAVTTNVLFDPWLLCPFEQDGCATDTPPTAAFSSTASTTPGSLDVSFDGSGSHDADGSVTAWSWDFGDGSSATGATTSHTYSATGTYAVTLTVTDDASATDQVTHDVTVPAVGLPSFQLTVTTSGGGTVTASGGISCPGTCSASYTSGTVVALSEAPASGQLFTGWTGACSGAGACVVTMTTARTVAATFTALGVGGSPPPPPVTPAVSIGDVSRGEGNAGDTPFVFAVTLSQATDSLVSVGYATADETASASSDYAGVTGIVTFGPGETSKTVTVLVHGDTTVEGDETFAVNLASPSGLTIAHGQGVGTIQNDDLPRLSIDDARHAEGNAGSTAFTFVVRLSEASTAPVSVFYKTANGTAGAADFKAASGLVTFAPGQSNKVVAISVTGDKVLEPDETFAIDLGRPVGATIADGHAVGTIVNDDPAADLAVTATAVPGSTQVGGSITFSIVVANKGPGTASEVLVTDTLPSQVSLTTIPSSCARTAAGTGREVTVHCRIAALPSQRSITYAIAVSTILAGTAVDTATVSSATGDPVSTNNTVTLSTKIVAVPELINPSTRAATCTVRGTAGDDTLTGPGRPGTVCGEAGDDTIDSGTAVSTIKGGPGNDVIDARNGRIDVVDGGPGYDTCICDPSDRVVNIERRVGQ